MSRYTAIELEKLAPPQIIEELSFSAIREAMIIDFRERLPAFDAILASDPAIMLLEAAAYRELLLRQRINNACKANLVATAQGTDLENIVAWLGVQRVVIDPGNPQANPPIPPIYESDTRLRERGQLALEGFTTAGSQGAYEFWAFEASGKVKDVDVYSPPPIMYYTTDGLIVDQPSGQVIVTVLSVDGEGIPTTELLQQVTDKLNADEVRPLTDQVIVQSPTVIHYRVEAQLYFYQGPDALVVRQLAEDRLREYVINHHLLGHDIPLSGLYAALHQTGVQRVVLISPTQNIVVSKQQVAYCTEIQVTLAGIDE